MDKLPVIIFLFLAIICAINSRKIGELAKNNEIFKYILLIDMVVLVIFIGFTVYRIFKT